MPVLSLISELQADAAALSPLRRNATSLGRSPNRHIPFVSAWRSLFTFQWLDIPIRAAPIYSFPLCRVQSLIFFLFLFFFLAHSFLFFPLRPPNTPLGGLFGFVSLKRPHCSLSYSSRLSVCLCLMAEHTAL